MTLSEKQKEVVINIWSIYKQNCDAFYVANERITPSTLDNQRIEVMPQIVEVINKFLGAEMPLDEFKPTIDGLNKRHRLWGFQGINGQMFFNMLFKSASNADEIQQLVGVLKESLLIPSSIDSAIEKIIALKNLTNSLGEQYEDPRSAPRSGSIPFFISYFWQIQDHSKWPIYYTSMINELVDKGLWVPVKMIERDYPSFVELNDEFISIITETTGEQPSYWDIEHVFWFSNQIEDISRQNQVEDITQQQEEVAQIIESLPESYIPPIVSVIPLLAKNDERISEICNQMGTSSEFEFEKRAAILFQMLGYEVEVLGQGHGRVPDGIAYSQEHRYAIIYDTKVRQDNYRMGTDERAIREYIVSAGERLRRQGYRNIYFMIISNAFAGDHDNEIRNIKIDTDVREVLLVEALALVKLLEGKLRNPSISLGPDGIQNLLAASGEITVGDIQEFIS